MINERQTRIRDVLFERGELPVHDLAEHLGASLATVRRDLKELEEVGIIVRMHGSARIASEARAEVAFGAREQQNLAAKRAIASAAEGHVRENTTIFLDAGTTILQLARKLKLKRMPITVFTNGLIVAQELAGIENITVCLLGGRLREQNMSVVGPLAQAMLENVYFDQLFLGASAISDDGWISSHDADEARANFKMAERARQTFVLCDASKIGEHATYSVLRLSERQHLITNARPNDPFCRHVTDSGTEMTIAGGDTGNG